MSKYVGKENLGEALHVALRKACDSAPTSAAYSTISLMPDSLWGEYVQIVGTYFDAAKKAKRLNEREAWLHLRYLSTKTDSDAYRDAREQFVVSMRDWREAGKTGKKPQSPIPYEPVSGLAYDPLGQFAHDRGDGVNLIRTLPKEECSGSVDDILQKRSQWRYLFQSVLRTFTDDDWKGFSCYVFQD